jgi:hypothetical protein
MASHDSLFKNFHVQRHVAASLNFSGTSGGSTLGLAMQACNLADDASDVPFSQDQSIASQLGNGHRLKLPKRLALDLMSQPSQDNMI